MERYESSINLNHHTDRYILKDNEKGMTYTCKFFFWDKGFIGMSLLAIYELNEHFNKNLIEEDDNGMPY
jgi:hypothetical protein